MQFRFAPTMPQSSLLPFGAKGKDSWAKAQEKKALQKSQTLNLEHLKMEEERRLEQEDDEFLKRRAEERDGDLTTPDQSDYEEYSARKRARETGREFNSHTKEFRPLSEEEKREREQGEGDMGHAVPSTGRKKWEERRRLDSIF